MHKYNPFELPEIIANIIHNLSLDDLNKLCWINWTWYKEVRRTLLKRCETLYNTIEKKYEKLNKHHNVKIEIEIHKDFVEMLDTEFCMFLNGMFSGKEKENMKYLIKKSIAKDIRQELRKRWMRF